MDSSLNSKFEKKYFMFNLFQPKIISFENITNKSCLIQTIIEDLTQTHLGYIHIRLFNLQIFLLTKYI